MFNKMITLIKGKHLIKVIWTSIVISTTQQKKTLTSRFFLAMMKYSSTTLRCAWASEPSSRHISSSLTRSEARKQICTCSELSNPKWNILSTEFDLWTMFLKPFTVWQWKTVMTHPGLLYQGRLATRGVSCRDRSKARTSEFSFWT